MSKNKNKPVKTEIIEETIEEPTEITPKTSEEAAIRARAESSMPDWDTITEESMTDFSLAEFLFDLPKEAKEKQDKKEFAYQWVKRDPSRIDACLHAPPPKRLWMCNRNNSPYLEKYIDRSAGCVVREDMVLMKRPWKMHRIYQAAKMDLFRGKEESGLIENRDGKVTDKARYMAGEEYKIGGGDEVFNEESAEAYRGVLNG